MLMSVGRLEKIYNTKRENLDGPRKFVISLLHNTRLTRFSIELLTIHESYVRSSVPASRLHFINIKDGWEPLCKILNCPVPNEPFPRANDTNAMQEFFEDVLRDAMVRWLVIFGVLGFIGIVYWFWVLKGEGWKG